MDALKHIFKVEPEIALFLSLFLGYALGRIKIKGFSLGGGAGSHIVTLIIGHMDVSLPNAVKWIFFALFIYTVGFGSGPEFFGGLNRASIKLVISSVVHCLAALTVI